MAQLKTYPRAAAVDAAKGNLGWTVTFAGTGINLALGILYSWSVISQAIPKEWNWSETEKSLPYSVACIVFAFAMIPAGRMQDKIGPRVVAALGGVLVGLGMILSSTTTSPLGYVIGFGILAGVGIGFGYGSATPPAVKWFSKSTSRNMAEVAFSVADSFQHRSLGKYMGQLLDRLAKERGIRGFAAVMLRENVPMRRIFAGLAAETGSPLHATYEEDVESMWFYFSEGKGQGP